MFEWSVNDAIVLLIALVVIVVVTILLAYILRGRSEKVKKIPLYVISGLIIILEIVRQVNYIVAGYDLNVIPLHFFNLVLFAFPLMLFSKGKLKSLGNAMTIVVVTMCAICLYLTPGKVLGSEATSTMFTNFDSFYIVLYYQLSILFLSLSFVLQLLDFDISTIVYFWLSFLIYSAFILVLSYWLEVAFINPLEYLVPVLEDFRLKFGMILYSTVMFLLTCGIGGILFMVERALDSVIKGKYNAY